MLNQIVDFVTDPQMMIVVLVGIAAFATVFTLAAPLFSGSRLTTRMKSVSTERDRLRAQRLAELQANSRTLRHETKGFTSTIMERYRLARLLDPEETREKLKRAGLRGPRPVMTYMFFQIFAPLAAAVGALLYLNFVNDFGHPPQMRVAFSVVAAAIGYYLPPLFIHNIIQKRQTSIRRAFPDALDLLLICVQSGMSIEAAFKLVAGEIGGQSVPLAEEFTLTTAEMSYLQERRQAYENLGTRTGLDGVKAVTTSLVQAERYGTPLSQSLRVLAQENRDARMAEAERRAAALPPKLTVPMILFFLPVLFVVILGPALIEVFHATSK
jgi:tight adherence protein C